MSLSVFTGATAYADGALEDEYGILYKVDEIARTAVVSAENSAKFQNQNVSIVIKPTVTDHKSVDRYSGEFTVTGMEPRCFERTAISGVEIQAEIETIPDYAFYVCHNLATLKFPSTLKSIGESAFEQESWYYSYYYDNVNDEVYESCDDNAPAELGEVEWPSELTYIGPSAFKYSTIRNINIPSGVETIFPNTFAYSYYVRDLAIAEGVKEIQGYAFINLCRVGRVELPAGLHLATYAFSACSFDELVLPERPLTVDSKAVANDMGITTVVIPGWMDTVNDFLYGASKLTYIKFDEGVRKIGRQAFSTVYSLAKVDFPSSLRVIDDRAFYSYSSKLTDFTLPERMDSIKSYGIVIPAGTLHVPKGVHLSSNALTGTFSTIEWPEVETEEDIVTFDNYPFGTGNTTVEAMTLPGWMSRVPDWIAYNWYGLKSLTIEEGVDTIGNYAFIYTGIENLHIPSSVRVVEEYAFSNISNLKSLTFDEGIDSIGEAAFSACESLERLELPESLKKVGRAAFYGASKLNYLKFPKDFPVIPDQMFESSTFGSEVESTIVWPENIHTIGERAFSGWSKLKDFQMPATVRTIKNSAFNNCGPFNILDLSKVTEIGYEAFSYSQGEDIIFPQGNAIYGGYIFRNFKKQNLPADAPEEDSWFTVTLPDGMTEIPDNMFNGFTNLKNVNIPQGQLVTKIGAGAFSYTRLTSFGDDFYAFPKSVVEIGKNAYYGDEINIKISKALKPDADAFVGAILKSCVFDDDVCDEEDYQLPMMPYVQFPTDYVLEIPDCVRSIPADAFKSAKLYGVKLPASLDSIGENAFSFSELKSIDFSQAPNLVKVGPNAFYKSGLTSINWGDHPFELGESCFKQASLSYIVIPAWMSEIPDNCFSAQGRGASDKYGNLILTTLKSVIFAERDGSVDLHIGSSAFHSNNYMANILALPSCNIVIEENAFKNNRLLSLIWPSDPYTVTLKSGAFRGCWGMIYPLTIPSNVILDGEEIFRGAVALKTLTIDGSHVSIPKGTFQNCAALTSLTLNEGTTTIGDHAFFGCKKLTAVQLPSTLTTLDECCFAVNTLRAINVPGSVKEISANAFAAHSLASIVLNEGLEVIGSGAFSNQYTPVRSFTGGMVGGYSAIAFHEQDSVYTYSASTNSHGIARYPGVVTPTLTTYNPLTSSYPNTYTSLSFPATLIQIGMEAFLTGNKLSTLEFKGQNVTSIGLGAFQNSLLEEVEINEPETDISVSGFLSCVNLKKATITARNISLGQAFSSCTALEELNINCPGGILTIGTAAARGCTALTTVNIDCDSLSVSTQSFQNCSKLRSFTSNTRRAEIVGMQSFANCSSLETLACTNEDFRLHSVGESAFDGCSSLKSFPYLAKVETVGPNAFRGCSSLIEIEYPIVGMRYFPYTTTDISRWEQGFFNGCTSLQSITFHNSGDVFKMVANDIAGAPLKAISYFDGTAPRLKSKVEWWDGSYPRSEEQIGWWKFDASTYTPADSRSILYVGRGQKWKFEEAGYGAVFDIRERKTPSVPLRGDIFSEFDLERNINNYHAVLSWDIQLSDLNMEAPTHFTIWRDNSVLVADATFSKPEIVPVSGYEGSTEAYKVSVTIADGTARPTEDMLNRGVIFSGYIDYVDEDDPTGLTYKSYNVTQNRDLYFDAVTHKRLDSFDKYSDYSPFILVERFSTTGLDSGEIPQASYSYTAMLDGYEYTEEVNNEGLVPDSEGNYYHSESRQFEGASSGEVILYPASVVPTLDFPGLYTRDEVLADRDATLAVTTHPDSGDGLTIDYVIPGNLSQQKGNDTFNDVQDYIIRKIDVYATDSNGNRKLTATIEPKGQPDGSVALDSDVRLEPNTQYQFVTTTMFRGTFGSPTLTIPGLPRLLLTYSVTIPDITTEGDGHDHADSDIYARSEVKMKYEVDKMGYADGEYDMQDTGMGFLGIWRGYGYDAPALFTDDGSAIYDNHQLIYHYDSMTEAAPDCAGCADKDGLTHEAPRFILSDVYQLEELGNYKGNYIARLYVKVPTRMLHNDDQWMLAEKPVSFGSGVSISGVEDVTLDASGAAADETFTRWFNLNGYEIQHPESGQIYIRVTPEGADKVLYHDN